MIHLNTSKFQVNPFLIVKHVPFKACQYCQIPSMVSECSQMAGYTLDCIFPFDRDYFYFAGLEKEG